MHSHCVKFVTVRMFTSGYAYVLSRYIPGYLCVHIYVHAALVAQLVECSPRTQSVVPRAVFSLKKEKAVLGVYICLALFIMYAT